jgi:hypothetical protein
MARHAPKSKKKVHGSDTAPKSPGPLGASKPAPVSDPKKGGKPKRKRGGPRFVPTPDQQTLVAVAKAAQYTDEQIAGLINFPHGISPKTLVKHFGEQLEHGGSLLNLKVAANLYRIATKQPPANATGPEDRGVVTAAIFVSKARMGWRDGSGGVSVTPPPGSTGSASITPDGQTVVFSLKLGDTPVAE